MLLKSIDCALRAGRLIASHHAAADRARPRASSRIRLETPEIRSETLAKRVPTIRSETLARCVLTALLLASAGSCTVRNPTYCDEQTRCASGYRCVIEKNLCQEDSTAPTIASRHPEADAERIPITAAIEVAFSEPIEIADAESSALVLSTGSSTVDGRLSQQPTQWRFEPEAPLRSGTRYQVTLGSVRDLAPQRAGRFRDMGVYHRERPGRGRHRPSRWSRGRPGR
jgi:hypothetical protein